MAAVPAFSTFSAISELFVTGAVLYFFWQAMRHNRYRWTLIWITITFETLFNITYMASRLSHRADANLERPAWETALLAIHGSLSLVMFLGLIVFVFVALRHDRVLGDNLVARRRGLSHTFIALWLLSVASGELIYALQLGGALQV